MRICRIKETKRIIEMQGGAIPGLLTKNAQVAFGLAPDEVEELEVDQAGYEAAKAEDPVEIATAQAAQSAAAVEAAKEQAFIDNLPSWQAVDTAITNIANLADAKAFIRKLSKVVYWMARNQET